MAIANSALRISELDFNSIKNNLKTFLQSQSEFVDYDFEGSGMSVLLDVLAYNTHYQAFYLNMVANEMFNDSAQLRASIISHAKHVNYVPGSMTGASAVVHLKVTPEGSEDLTATTLTLPKFTKFYSAPIDGVSYVFSTTNANTATKVSGSFNYNNLIIRQGEPVIQQYAAAGQPRFTIPSANVDIDTIAVTVQESSSNTVTYTYTLADDLTEITNESKVYFIEENSDVAGNYTIEFGDGVLGKRLSNDNIVIVRYIDTHGEYGNKANVFSIATSVGGYSNNVRVTSVSAAAGGSAKESIEEIRTRAPIAYTAQNRAVTKNDYESLLLRDYPNIDALSVWSGDENDPPIYGKVFISMKPVDNYEISLLEKERIKDDIIATRSVLTVTPEIIDPDYTYILVNAAVNYDPALTTLDETELKQLIRSAILEYKQEELQSFNSTFRMSKLQKAIDNAHESIIGSSVRLVVQKRAELTLNEDKIYKLSYDIPLYRGVVEDKFYTYPDVTVLDNDGVSRQVYIEDTPNSLTGIDSIGILNSGSGYQTPPTVTITGDGTGATATAKIVNGRVTSITVTNRGIDYTTAVIAITSDSGSGATAAASLQAKNGTLRSYYYKTNGEKVIVNSNIGSIDYIKGEITILSIEPTAVTENDRYTTNYLTFNAVPYNNLITPVRNRILDIDEEDSASIAITLIPEV